MNKEIHRELMHPTSARYSTETLFIAQVSCETHAATVGRPKAIPGEEIRRVVEDLAEWLGITRTEVAEVGRFNRRSISNWATKGAYPSTVRHLLAVHALVSAVIARLGVDGARQWINSQAGGASAEAASIVAMLSDDDRIGELVSEASGFLFVTPPRLSQFAELALEEDVEPDAAVPATRSRKPVKRVVAKPVKPR